MRRFARKLLAILSVILLACWPASYLLPGRDKIRAHRTIRDMLRVSRVLGIYHEVHSRYPPAWTEAFRQRGNQQPAPTTDAWGNAYRYVVTTDLNGQQSYTLTSLGKDGLAQGFVNDVTKYLDCDLILNDGQFVQAEEPLCCGAEPCTISATVKDFAHFWFDPTVDPCYTCYRAE